MGRMLLMRHGATEYNEQVPYILQGTTMDPPVSANGRRQISALAKATADLPIAVVYHSPMVRARQTAEAVAAARAVPLVLVPELIEIDIGVWEGLHWTIVKDRWPAEYQAFMDPDAKEVGYLGGENFVQVRDRAVPTLERLAANHPDEVIAVVSHNVLNRIALAQWIGLPLPLSRRLPQENACINVIDFPQGKPKVRTINLVNHLSEPSSNH